MKITQLGQLADGTPLIGGISCLKCHQTLPNDTYVDDDGYCLVCDWTFGVPEDEIEVLHHDLLVAAGLPQSHHERVPVAVTSERLTRHEAQAMWFACRRIANLHPEAFGLFYEQWFAQQGLQAPRRVMKRLDKTYLKVVAPIHRFLRDKELESRRTVR